MTLRAREQDIRREKAASNICTNQALLALAASIYVATVGPHGLRDVAALGAARAAELEAALAAAGAPRLHAAPYLNEFVVRVPDAPAVHARLLDRGVLAGIPTAPLLPDEPSLADGLLVCATEVTTAADIERFASSLRGGAATGDGVAVAGGVAMSVVGERLQPTLFERSRPGRGGGKIPHPPADALDRIPAAARRATPPGAARAERARGRPPLRQPVAAQLRGRHGLLPARLVHDEVQPQAERVGRAAARLRGPAPDGARRGRPGHAPAAVRARGAAGRDQRHGRGHAPAGGRRPRRADRHPDDPRLPPVARRHSSATEVLVPDSSHGTNPATATMAGFRTITIPSAADGGVDLDAFRAALGPRTAAIMITNPSTLGLFERRIGELLDATHEAGALAYMDGANLNAILGRFKPGEAGFDVMHFNTHKTFSTPHGGGGPGAGPVGVRPALVPFLPAPRVLRADDGTFRLEAEGERPTSIGRMRSFVGSTRRPRARVRVPPRPRRRRAAGGVRRRGPGRELPQGARRRRRTGSRSTAPCKHEFVASAADLKQRTGVRTLDVAKRLIDKGYHPPTIYFPLTVEEGDADRAHRDGVARDPRRLRGRADRDRARGRDAIPTSSPPRRTTRRSAASTRRPPRASRTFAGAA